MAVIRLFDSPKTLTALTTDTLHLMHSTMAVPAIKRLLTVHDILDLNLKIQLSFRYDPPWDFAALQDLNILRRELFVYHLLDFTPMVKFEVFNTELKRLLHVVSLAYEKDLARELNV